MKLSELLGEPQAVASQPPPTGLRLSARNAPEDSPMSSWPASRALGFPTTGEALPVSWPSDGQPANLDPSKWSHEQRWWTVAHLPAAQLMVVLESGQPDQAWLGLAPNSEIAGIPLLLMKLPCVTWTGEPINGGSCPQSSGS